VSAGAAGGLDGLEVVLAAVATKADVLARRQDIADGVLKDDRDVLAQRLPVKVGRVDAVPGPFPAWLGRLLPD